MDTLKGIIAIDIDGTLTHDPRILHSHVQSYVQFLMHNGWKFIFLTGRTFSFAWPILSSFSTPYYLSCQNGAHLLEMPSRHTLIKHYLDFSVIEFLENTFKKAQLPLVIESGYAHGDITYYHKEDFISEELLKYLDVRKSLSTDSWIAVDSFKNIQLNDFATGKYFSLEREIVNLPFYTCTLRDPFRPGYVLTHITHEKATKGHVMREFCKKFSDLPFIAAGDDYNDYEMLLCADVKIVSDHAPQTLKDIADIVAPAGEGMIGALQEAFKKL